jgi:hypothetical protein
VSTLARVLQEEEISTCYHSFFIVGFSLVNRAYSWLYFVIRNILSKEILLGFSQDKYFCLIFIFYLLLDLAYIFSIWLLNVKRRSNYSGKSIATEISRKSNKE